MVARKGKAEQEQVEENLDKPTTPVENEDVAKADAEAETADITAEVEQAFDVEQEKGYRGTVPDPTPNFAYTVQGVGQGEPTPETDPDLAAQTQPGLTKFNNK